MKHQLSLLVTICLCLLCIHGSVANMTNGRFIIKYRGDQQMISNGQMPVQKIKSAIRGLSTGESEKLKVRDGFKTDRLSLDCLDFTSARVTDVCSCKKRIYGAE